MRSLRRYWRSTDPLTKETNGKHDWIDPYAAFATGVADRLALSLATLVVDQTLLSESDVPFEPFTAAFAVDQRSCTAFRDALGLSRLAGGHESGVGVLHIGCCTLGNGDRRAERASATLDLVMRGSLRSLRQGSCYGDVAVPFFLFGRSTAARFLALLIARRHRDL